MGATTGIQFGRYLLRERLGVGGMASVWRAVDDRGRALVVKRILPSLQGDAEFVAMFDREATLSARLTHPNIVRVFDHGSYEGERYLAMEELHGRDLGSVMMELTTRAQPPPELGAYVGREMALALAYVHALADDAGKPLGLVHRDVSLSNVMLCFDGSVKLLDFGVAKALATQVSGRTQAGVLKGKWSYLAPEQVEGRDVDQRADLFALGIVLWEMLTGRRLFKAATGLETLEKVRAANVPPPSTVNPLVPPALDAVCARLLARARDDRFASAVEVAAVLDRVCAGLRAGEHVVAEAMSALFVDAAMAYGESQQTTRIEKVSLASLDVARSLDDVPPLPLPPLPPLRAHRRVRARALRMLLAALVAAVLGSLTGWQIAQARAHHRVDPRIEARR